MKVISDAAATVQKRSSSGSDKQKHGYLDRSPNSHCSSPKHSYVNKSPHQSFTERSPNNSYAEKSPKNSYTDKSPKQSYAEKSPKHSFYENVPKSNSPKTSVADNTEDIEFLNKVSKYELISHNKTSPTVKSPMRVMPPESPSQASPSNTMKRRQNNSSNVSSHTGEKLFTRETVTTRVPASFLCGKSTPTTTTDRVPSTGSTSSSSLTSVSSNSGATLSWTSDSPKSNNSTSSIKTVQKSPNSSIENSPKSKSPQHSIALTPRDKKPLNLTESATSKVRMATNAELLAESIMNGDLLTVCDLDNENNRNTFDGMDFDFNELTASQQDLTMKHREIVAERKKEQEQEKIEKQRLEEILSMCAEYEKQIEDERTVQENPKPKTTAWSMQRFLETPQRSSESPKQAHASGSIAYVIGQQHLPKVSQQSVSNSPSYMVPTKQGISSEPKSQYLKNVENVKTSSPLMNGPSSPYSSAPVTPTKTTPPPISPKPVLTNKTFDMYSTHQSDDIIHQSIPVTMSKQMTNQVHPNTLTYQVTSQVHPNTLTQKGTSQVHPNTLTHQGANQVHPNTFSHQVTSPVHPSTSTYQVTSNTTTAVVHHNFSSPSSSVMNSNYKIEPLTSDKTNKENPDKRLSPPPDYEDDLVDMTNTMSVSTNMKPSVGMSTMDYGDAVPQHGKGHNSQDSHLKGHNSLDSNSFNSGIQDMNIKHEMESLGSENHSDNNITENQLPRFDENSFKISQVQRPNQLPSFLDFTKEVHSLDRKEKSEYRGSMTKIKTNGSLTMLSSPNNSHKDIVHGFQMRRCSSNSSNSEEESTSGTNSEDTGTIKRRPEINRNKDNSFGGSCSPLGSPCLSPRMGSRSPQVSRRHFKADDKSREIIHSPTEQDQNVNSVDFFNSAVNGMLFNDKLEFKSCDNAGENDQRNNYCVTNQNQRIYENLQFRNNPLTNSNIVNGFTGTENNISSLEIEQSMSSSRLSAGSSGSRKSDDRLTPVNDDSPLSKSRERIKSDDSTTSNGLIQVTIICNRV